jgi:hypothetical protein
MDQSPSLKRMSRGVHCKYSICPKNEWEGVSLMLIDLLLAPAPFKILLRKKRSRAQAAD